MTFAFDGIEIDLKCNCDIETCTRSLIIVKDEFTEKKKVELLIVEREEGIVTKHLVILLDLKELKDTLNKME